MDLWDGFLLRMRLHYQRHAQRIQALEAASLHEIELMLDRCVLPYVAVSGGKDSLVMLHLVRQLRPEIPCMWADEWDAPDTHAMLDTIERQWGNKVWRFRYAQHPEFYGHYKAHPVCSQPIRIDVQGVQFNDFVRQGGYDGVFVGMRRDESRWRNFVLKKSSTAYLAYADVVRCSPLADWKLDDLWAYTFHHNLPNHPRYKAFINYGVEPKGCRIGGMLYVTIRTQQYGRFYLDRLFYPDTYMAMLDANPCMSGDR